MIVIFLALLLLFCPSTTSLATYPEHASYKFSDEHGQSVFPQSVRRVGNDLYFLTPECLWWCAGSKTTAGKESLLILKRIKPPTKNELPISLQELSALTYRPHQNALVILNKSGDVFAYSLDNLKNKRWEILRANSNTLGQPDPDYVSLCIENNNLLLLDPERNQIWFMQSNKSLKGILPGKLSYRLKPGDINITDGISINCLNGIAYLLRRNGNISQFALNPNSHISYHRLGTLHFKKPYYMRPTRFCLDDRGNLYIVERENNRVLKICSSRNITGGGKNSSSTLSAQCRGGSYATRNIAGGIASAPTTAFIFPGSSDLRGLVVSGNGFWIINGDHFLYKGTDEEKPPIARINHRAIDKRLVGLILPIAGQQLPGHPGVYPGARRLYRFGIHEGLDLFNQPGAKMKIITGTPVRACCAGEIIRLDSHYKDMSYNAYHRVIKECTLTHQTSDKNEDLLRGCQVWIDSHNGLITKYGHLSRVNLKLHTGDYVKQGDIIGFVGISGTGENLPGRMPYPHLHFEIWLDGKYLGWGLNSAEVMSLFENIFAPNRSK